jgi:hypothetical protein
MLRFRIISLEERIVLDAEVGDQLQSVDDLDSNQDDQINTADLNSSSNENLHDARVLVVSSNIDDEATSVNESQLLASAAKEGVVVIQYDLNISTIQDLYRQIEEVISESSMEKVNSIAFANHGGEGFFSLLENLNIDDKSLENQEVQEFWINIKSLIKEGGRIDLLSCDLVSSEEGLTLVQDLEKLTGIDVAASQDTTGDSDFGGNWNLETDNIDTEKIYFDHLVLQTFDNVLSTFKVKYDDNSSGVTESLFDEDSNRKIAKIKGGSSALAITDDNDSHLIDSLKFVNDNILKIKKGSQLSFEDDYVLDNGDGTGNIALEITDSFITTTVDLVIFDVSNVPAVDMPEFFLGMEGEPIFLTGMTVEDEGNYQGSGRVKLTLSVDYGDLKIVKLNKLIDEGELDNIVLEGNKSSKLILKGLPEDINAVMKSIKYLPEKGFHGPMDLKAKVNGLGHYDSNEGNGKTTTTTTAMYLIAVPLNLRSEDVFIGNIPQGEQFKLPDLVYDIRFKELSNYDETTFKSIKITDIPKGVSINGVNDLGKLDESVLRNITIQLEPKTSHLEAINSIENELQQHSLSEGMEVSLDRGKIKISFANPKQLGMAFQAIEASKEGVKNSSVSLVVEDLRIKIDRGSPKGEQELNFKLKISEGGVINNVKQKISFTSFQKPLNLKERNIRESFHSVNFTEHRKIGLVSESLKGSGTSNFASTVEQLMKPSRASDKVLIKDSLSLEEDEILVSNVAIKHLGTAALNAIESISVVTTSNTDEVIPENEEPDS